MEHQPVMVDEIVSIFAGAPEGYFIDATIGPGGHSLAIGQRLPGKFRFIGCDRDPEMIELARDNVPAEYRLVNMPYSQIPSMIREESISPLAGVLFDPGLNSVQLDRPDRGFSYRRSSILDLRFDRESGKPFCDLLDELSLSELTDILKSYGQEKRSRSIARAIMERRPRNTDELGDIIRAAVGPGNFVKTASRVFQAIRIFINNELEELETALKGIIPLISIGGRIAVISYHSLEDGIVKRIFRLYSGRCQCGPGIEVCECGAVRIIEVKTKKPVRPGNDELRRNPRARSARMRYAEKG